MSRIFFYSASSFHVHTVQHDESVKDLVAVLDVLGDDDPVVHGHVAGVEEGIVLVDGVDDPLVVGHVWEDQGQEARLLRVSRLLAGIHLCSKTDLGKNKDKKWKAVIKV